jgi:hypothetical protein
MSSLARNELSAAVGISSQNSDDGTKYAPPKKCFGLRPD